MNSRLLPLVLCLAVASCSSPAWQKYSTHLAAVKSQAATGKDVRVAKKDLETMGYEVSDPIFPTKKRNYQSIHVYYGASRGMLDGLRYSMDIPTSGPPGAIVVLADPEGKITRILEETR